MPLKALVHKAQKEEQNLGNDFDQLQRRGWILVNRCFLAKEKREQMITLSSITSEVRILWQLVFSLFHIAWVLLSLAKILFWIDSSLLWRKSVRRFGGLLLCAFYELFGRIKIRDCQKVRNKWIKCSNPHFTY